MKEKLRRRGEPTGMPLATTQLERPDASPPDPYEAAIFAAELGAEVPELDLHGLDVNLALSKLDTFLQHHIMLDAEVVKIIHGRGTQKLQQAIHAWLRQPPQQGLVARFRDTENPTQQNAVTYVALYRLK